VAELNAISHMTPRLSWKKFDSGSVNATAASDTPSTICRMATHERLVPNISIRGDHSGLITQGRYSQPV